jgi:hypothetical protein
VKSVWKTSGGRRPDPGVAVSCCSVGGAIAGHSVVFEFGLQRLLATAESSSGSGAVASEAFQRLANRLFVNFFQRTTTA